MSSVSDILVCAICKDKQNVFRYGAPYCKSICENCVLSDAWPKISLEQFKASLPPPITTPPQKEALEDYALGSYLQKGREPSSTMFTSPLNLTGFRGSIAITGGVGVGKSTLLDVVLHSMAISRCRVGEYLTEWRLPSKEIIISVSDFSRFISSNLRDISTSAHFLASVFYREVYRDLFDYLNLMTGTPWRIVFDRFFLENIVFATDPTIDSGPLFRHFWPSECALASLRALMPKQVYVICWLKDDDYTIDNTMRSKLVQKRNRCDYELATVDDDYGWFYSAALDMYEKCGAAPIILNLNGDGGAAALAQLSKGLGGVKRMPVHKLSDFPGY